MTELKRLKYSNFWRKIRELRDKLLGKFPYNTRSDSAG